MGATRARHVRGALILAALGVLAVAPTSAASGPPDRIAFSRLLDGGGAAVFTANPDGSGEQPVPLGDAEEDFGIPIWSPDHTRLLITNTLRFDANGDLRPFRPAIVNPDGTGYHVLEIPGRRRSIPTAAPGTATGRGSSAASAATRLASSASAHRTAATSDGSRPARSASPAATSRPTSRPTAPSCCSSASDPVRLQTRSRIDPSGSPSTRSGQRDPPPPDRPVGPRPGPRDPGRPLVAQRQVDHLVHAAGQGVHGACRGRRDQDPQARRRRVRLRGQLVARRDADHLRRLRSGAGGLVHGQP